MLLGIDVGGTFTDAVAVDAGRVVAYSKASTTHDDLLEGILASLDKILPQLDITEISRVALSTTIVTNALIEDRTDRVGFCLIPGPGMEISKLVPGEPFILSGYIDHRGREAKELEQQEIAEACQHFLDCDVYAVAGKFAVRNPKHEMEAAKLIRKKCKPQYISLGSTASGSLNFWRRANSAYYNAAVWRQFNEFTVAIERAIAKRGITAPLFILKADGGTLPLKSAKDQPIEAIFTGPAASVLGIMAMVNTIKPAVSLDIGGTTTDIALWHGGQPVFSERGAVIKGYPTAVRSFRLKSVGLGGDSFVRWEDNLLQIGPMRRGPSMANGGSLPTVSDALITAGFVKFGDIERARSAMKLLAMKGQSPNEMAALVLEAAVLKITNAIKEMLDEQAAEPVYRVADIVHADSFIPELLLGVGGTAAGLAPIVAKALNIPCHVPDGAEVANAIGAAVARPTIDITLRADTEQGYYTVAEIGVQQNLGGRSCDCDSCYELAKLHLEERAEQAGIPADDIEIIQQEEFNIVRGYHTAGKIITNRLQIKPGVLVDLADSKIGEGLV